MFERAGTTYDPVGGNLRLPAVLSSRNCGSAVSLWTENMYKDMCVISMRVEIRKTQDTTGLH